MTHISLAKPSAALAKKHSLWRRRFGSGICPLSFYISTDFSRRLKTYPRISLFYWLFCITPYSIAEGCESAN